MEMVRRVRRGSRWRGWASRGRWEHLVAVVFVQQQRVVHQASGDMGDTALQM